MKYQNLQDPTIRFRAREEMVNTIHLVIEFPAIRFHRAVSKDDILETAKKMSLAARTALEKEQ